MGAHADGYNKLKSVIRILEDKLLPQDRYKWDRELFGPESTGMSGDLLYNITRFDVDCILDFSKLKLGEPVHHNYSMTIKGLNSFMDRKQAYLEGIPKETEPLELMSEFAMWRALPPSCAVAYAMQNKYSVQNNGSNGHAPLQMLIKNSKLSPRILRGIVNWYRDLGFTVKRPDSHIGLYVTEEAIQKVNSRYKYLLIDKIDDNEAKRELSMALTTLRHIYHPEPDFENQVHKQLQDRIQEIESSKSELNQPLTGKLESLGKIFTKIQESESPLVLKFGQKREGLMLKLALEHKNGFKMGEMLYIWYVLQPAEVYSLFNQIPYEQLKSSLQPIGNL